MKIFSDIFFIYSFRKTGKNIKKIQENLLAHFIKESGKEFFPKFKNILEDGVLNFTFTHKKIMA